MNRFINNLTAPAPPYVAELAVFPVAVVPFALAALESRTVKYVWADEENYQRGVQLIRSLQVALLTGGMQELIESNNRLYRLLDSALYGRQYTQVSVEPLEITPVIPAAPDTTAFPAGLIDKLEQLPGILDAGWFGIGGRKATIADIVTALRVGKETDATSIIDGINGLLDAGSDVTTMADFIEDLFNNTVQTAADGGILATLFAMGAAQAVMMGAQAAQLDRLIKSLDGGGLTGPADNVLLALRGTTEADTDRNVIDSQNSTVLADALTQLITELQANGDVEESIVAKLEEIKALL
jgi:hypothetical protein